MKINWWDRVPGRLEYEKKELDKNNIKYKVDDNAFKNGKLIIYLQYKFKQEILKLKAEFPDYYPFFRFEVFAPELDLPKHQNPIAKNICLIGRRTENWDSSSTLADFIINQLPKVLNSQNKNSEVSEEPQGEPVSEYFRYLQNYIVYIDSLWNIDNSIESGFLSIGINDSPARAVILNIFDNNKKQIATFSDGMEKMFLKKIETKWVRCSQLFYTDDAKIFYDNLSKSHPEIQGLKWVKTKDFKYRYLGVVFSEEVQMDEYSDGWMFILMVRKNNQPAKYFFVRAGRCGKMDMSQRIPELKFLKDKKVAVIGLGSIGAPSAIEFAKAGVGELRIIDNDYVSPGTVVRWPLGLMFTPFQKTQTIKHFIDNNYPYTKVISLECRIGSFDVKQFNEIEKIFDGIDLIYDATAEHGVHHFLSDYSRNKKIPYMLASTTLGAWGGVVARFIPNEKGMCWLCFEEAKHDGTIPEPLEDLSGSIQPFGCGDPTFTGANFDIQQIAMMGVRTAISTLSSGNGNDYPIIDWNVAIAFFRDSDGNLINPTWETFNLKEYPSCQWKKI